MNFHKIFPFEVYLLVGTLWHLYETSEIRVVRGELGADFYKYSCIDRPNGLEGSRESGFSGRVQEQRSMSALDQLLVRFVKEEIHLIFSIAMH